jgi:hypothetical protein
VTDEILTEPPEEEEGDDQMAGIDVEVEEVEWDDLKDVKPDGADA